MENLKTIKEIKYKLWFDNGYDYPYLNRISIPELKGIYYTHYDMCIEISK